MEEKKKDKFMFFHVHASTKKATPI